MSIELFAVLIPAFLLTVLCLLILTLIAESSRQKSPYKQRKTKLTKIKARVKFRAFYYSIQSLLLFPFLLFYRIFLKPSPPVIYLTPLQTELMGLVQQDWGLANRLVDYERAKNPGKDEDWYWKSAIQSLIRDRR